MNVSPLALACALPLAVLQDGAGNQAAGSGRVELKPRTAELLTAMGMDPAAPPPVGTPAGELGREGLLEAPQLPVLAHPNQLEMLNLRDGSILWGAIAGHTPEGMTVQRLDTGGLVQLPFGLLDPRVELQLRQRFGYGDVITEGVFVAADRIPLVGGDELIGVVQHRAGGVLHVKQESGVVLLPVTRIAGAITQIQVPARTLYTREQLMERERLRLLPELESTGETRAAALFELGNFAERISDHRSAVEAYGEIPEGDQALFSDYAGALARSEAKAAVQEQVDFLDDAEHLARRGKFTESLTLMAEFPKRYERSPLLEDWSRTVRRIEQDRDRELTDFVAQRWFTWTARLVREGARLDSFDLAREWVENELPDMVSDSVASECQGFLAGIDGDRVRAIFADRRRQSTRRASYGTGSWLLGRDNALAGKLVEPEEEQAPVSDRDAERQALLERIERYQRNTQSVSGGGTQDSQLDPELFWESLTLSVRARWLTAYYVENGGDFAVSSVSLLPHRDCAGLGYREVLDVNLAGESRRRLILDPTCGGLGVTRRVSYR